MPQTRRTLPSPFWITNPFYPGDLGPQHKSNQRITAVEVASDSLLRPSRGESIRRTPAGAAHFPDPPHEALLELDASIPWLSSDRAGGGQNGCSVAGATLRFATWQTEHDGRRVTAQTWEALEAERNTPGTVPRAQHGGATRQAQRDRRD